MEKIMGDEDREEDTMIGSPSSDGKMVIKLKIPKLTVAMEGEKPSSSKTAKEGETMNNQGKRVCPDCKKEFSSGKALGGHMRVHVQAANKNNNSTFPKPLKTTKFKKTDFNNGDGNSKLTEQQQKKTNYKSCLNDDGEPTCYLCGKIFPSMKSLFGHMRCHPERVYRGILPPPNTPTVAARRRKLVGKESDSFASSSSTSSSDNNDNEEGSNIVDNHGDQVVDLTKFLRGWSVTERRGRPALKVVDDDDEEVLLEAVEELMSLAHGDGQSMAESDVTQRVLGVEVIEGSNSNSLTNNDKKIDEKNSPSIDLHATGKTKAVMEEEEIEVKPSTKMEVDDAGMIKNFSDNESISRNTEQFQFNFKYKNPFTSSYKSPTKVKKRKKMKLMLEFEQFTVAGGNSAPPLPLSLALPVPEQSAAINDTKYKCSTCNKCFASHQALGGHRSSHNKTKMITSTDQACDYESSLMNQSGENNTEKEVEFAADTVVALVSNGNNNGVHQCKICDKVFSTGQALGGHKRCHWTGTTEAAQAPSSQITSAGEAGSQTECGGGRRKGLDIDLNELPPTMMEDEAGNGNGNGNGYASSSYNSYMG